MKKRILLVVFVMIFLLADIPALAAPQGYNKYGDLADEYYYDELSLLACVVQAEAGNQDLHGKELVADVVLNRMDSDMFPSTIKEIIFQKNQFSTVTDGALDEAYYTVTDECYQAVRNELNKRNDNSILFFSAGTYSQYGRNAYKYGDHYFSR